jgi:medium-chain acyl-[acyl-carrier-protein] hydrolase
VASSWILRFDPKPQADLRLFCFPYAGVGASCYRAWPALLPPEFELCAVQPPGREGRLREPPFRSIPELVEAAAAGLEPYFDRPFAFFGHSMGALVAFEVARLLRRGGRTGPCWLFASGRRGPRVPDREPPLQHLPDAEFVAEIQRRYGGIPDQVLQHRELLELLLPGLRADVAALDTYVYRPGEPLDCPVTAFGGMADKMTLAEDLDAWRAETRGAFELEMFPGGHFFIDEARPRVVERVVATLRGVLAASSGTGSDP